MKKAVYECYVHKQDFDGFVKTAFGVWKNGKLETEFGECYHLYMYKKQGEPLDDTDVKVTVTLEEKK